MVNSIEKMIEEKWINIDKIVCDDAVKPCHYFPACPYGTLVELFPLLHGEHSCEVFGHDCPVFYHIEGIIEFSAMVEWEDDIIPEANNVSPIKSYDNEIFFEKFFNGLSNFINNNSNKIDAEKDVNIKKLLIEGFQRIINELKS